MGGRDVMGAHRDNEHERHGDAGRDEVKLPMVLRGAKALSQNLCAVSICGQGCALSLKTWTANDRPWTSRATTALVLV